MTDAPAVIPARPRVRWPLSLIVGTGLTAVVMVAGNGYMTGQTVQVNGGLHFN